MHELHEPVLVREVVEHLIWRPDGSYLDGTVGTGGHAEAILHAISPTGRLICVDQDPAALNAAQERLGRQSGRVHYHRGSFSELDTVLEAQDLDSMDGILLDLGLNSWSLSRRETGLSYQIDAPLRMDLDPDLRVTAADLLARASERELADIFFEYGGTRRARLYARRIADVRRRSPVRTTGDFVAALNGNERLSPGEMSRLFQAVRVAVCREMERLEQFLGRAGDWIRPGGRLVIISYASHEDRRVKGLTRRGEGTPGAFRPLLRSPVRPGGDEVARNRRARSALLRCFERRG